ncbi:MAG: hypothetical protein J1E78_00185 [Muribaculaceae bacterium]|nr:hypothetical protein [Muribaculaceae bacterium]
MKTLILHIICIFTGLTAGLPSAMAKDSGLARQIPEEPIDTAAYVDGMILVKTPLEADVPEEGDMTVVTADDYHPYGLDNKREFNPSPERAVWMSALFPGLGQIYNRRYWKLPIIVGGYMGLGYATGWNNSMLQEYSQAYRDILDNDPSTKSYMNFFPPNTPEDSLNKTWLTNVLKARRDYYRRNRDLCIISCVGLYLLCMVDAYVDASLAHFDISPDLSLDWGPAVGIDPALHKINLGIQWALNF